MTTRRPAIRRGPASQYAGANEAIAEFTDGASGGLISVRRNTDGALLVDVYRTDADVIVRGPVGKVADHVPPADLAGIADIAAALGVRRNVVNNWASRHADFPAPVARLEGAGRLWLLSQVRAWHTARWPQ